MISYRVEPTISDESLNELLATAWAGHRPSLFERILKHSLTYVCAYEAELLVGFVYVAWDGGGHAFILHTTVRRSHRRRGIGTGLVERASTIAKDRGVEWVHVDFEPHLEGFYRQCGFRHTEAGLLNLRR